MKKNNFKIFLIIFITVFTTCLIQPGLLKAADHDFGEVEIGSTETIPVSITSPAPIPIEITLEFDNTACTDFSVVPTQDLGKPFTDTIWIEVGFTPLQLGSCSNTLTAKVKNNEIVIDFNSVNLTGTGIEAISDQPEPFNLSRPYLTRKDDCKKGGWETLTRDDGSPFKNQGDCIQYMNTGK
jgi:hypothetical protein